MSELSPNAMSDTIDKSIIFTFFIVNNPYACHPYLFITENYSSKFMIIFFGLLPQNSLLKMEFPKKSFRVWTEFSITLILNSHEF